MEASINDSYSVENPAEFLLKTRFFANNTVSFVVHRVKHRIQKFHKDNFQGIMTYHPKTLTDEQKEEKRLDNLRRATSRAKQQIHHAVRNMGADHMLTLHTRENIQIREDFFTLFTRFIKLVRTKDLVNGKLVTRPEKRVYPFCAVPELQDRGAYHMHMAVVGFQDIPLLRACWYVALGGAENDKGIDVLGQIDVTSSHKRWGGETETFKTQKLVGYMVKYMGKTFEENEMLGIHRYSVSRRDIPKTKTQKQFLHACYSNGSDDYVDALKEVYQYAEFLGVQNLVPFNRDLDMFILRGDLSL